MLLGLLAWVACGEAPPPPGLAGEALVVEVRARVADAGAPAAWSAEARWTRLAREAEPTSGLCRRLEDGHARSTGFGETLVFGENALVLGEELVVGGETGARLAWHPERGAWGAEGPRQALDPAWSVADLAWTDADGEAHVAEDSVRFGGLPDVTLVTRDREGDVTLGWDPLTVEEPQIVVAGPAGALVCGAGPDGVTLPWWAVPASGGQVVLRSAREQTLLVDGVLVRARSVIERVIPLDRPAGTTAEEKEPRFRPYSPHGPRRLVRPPKASMG